jgi:hypothetical protein
MARMWKEKRSSGRAYRKNSAAFEQTLKKSMENPELIQLEDIRVHVSSFTFRFESVEHIRECLAYYQKKTHPSSRVSSKQLASELGEDWRSQRSWEVERWFERLPMYLLEGPKREKVVKALSKAVRLAESGKLPSRQIQSELLRARRGSGDCRAPTLGDRRPTAAEHV